MAWVRACGRDEIDEDEPIRIETVPPIAVFNLDGEFYATADTCTHDQSSLADGYVDGDRVECSWHFAKFCIRTGAVLSLPATTGLATYAVKVAGDDVMVYVPD